MRIELGDTRLYPELQDYFLRLGADVKMEENAIDIRFAEDLLDKDESPELYFRSWMQSRRIESQSTERSSPELVTVAIDFDSSWSRTPWNSWPSGPSSQSRNARGWSSRA